MISKHDSLSIRACKGNLGYKETLRRLRKIERMRCALPEGYEVRDWDVLMHLIGILGEVKWLKLLEDSLGSQPWREWKEFDQIERYILSISLQIRFEEISSFPGFIKSAYWKNT